MSGQQSTSADIELSVQNVSKRFGDFVALHNVNLDIKERELHVFLGPSGCGKTTLLRAIAGFEPVDEGRILHKGKSIDRPGASRGFVFQEGIHFPWRTVIQNIHFGPEMNGKPKEVCASQARHFLELVGLKGFEGYYPSQISGGMKQRMVLATALANNPDMLLMDEPFAALDAQTRTYMQGELLRIWSEAHKTVVFVTHSIREALLIGSRISLFKTRPGEIVKIFDIDSELGQTNLQRDPADPRLIEMETSIYKMIRQDEIRKVTAHTIGAE
jgi:NitT/TauT family transport system ATP-binding protein